MNPGRLAVSHQRTTGVLYRSAVVRAEADRAPSGLGFRFKRAGRCDDYGDDLPFRRSTSVLDAGCPGNAGRLDAISEGVQVTVGSRHDEPFNEYRLIQRRSLFYKRISRCRALPSASATCLEISRKIRAHSGSLRSRVSKSLNTSTHVQPLNDSSISSASCNAS